MRSSKSRSRSKSNRNRSVGNIVNRVFDSSGPEGKVRGTPQQIIEKYNQLARDAQLGNDRVSTENFQQHAEHYTRMLSEAQREAEARREQQEAQNRERQREREEARGQMQQDQTETVAEAPAAQAQQAPIAEPQSEETMPVDGVEGLGEVVDLDTGSESGLVETPESKPRRQRRPRKPRNSQPNDDAQASEQGTSVASAAPETADASQPAEGAAVRSDSDNAPPQDDPVRSEAAE